MIYNFELSSSFFFFSKLFHVRPVTQGDVYRAETDEIPRIFQVGHTFSLIKFYNDFHVSIYPQIFNKILFNVRNVFVTGLSGLYVFRFCMLMRESAGRRRTWRQFLRATRPTVSHTKAMSSSPRYITSLPIVRLAPNPYGTSSSRQQPWSVAAAM